MPALTQLYARYPYSLPILSALALVLTLPPFDFWPLVLIALVPLYLFIYRESDTIRIFTGVLFFGLIFSGYLTYVTLFSFTWIPQAHLFSSAIKLFAVPFVICISVVTALGICLLKTEKKGLQPLERVLLFGIFSIIEWLIGSVFIGFNYGSLTYAASHIPALRYLASIGGAFLVSFMVVFGNAAIAEALQFVSRPKTRTKAMLLPLGVFITIYSLSFLYQQLYPVVQNTSQTTSIAIIQDQTRKEADAFGSIQHGEFTFPLLERRVKEALAKNPDIIIYPFSPWIGAISSSLDNRRFTKDVIGMDYATFGRWLRAHLPPDTTLATWDTHFENGTYWNEINFWRNGKIVGTYQKRRLFPFMDYTPRWSADHGVYSTPYDGTAGTSTTPIAIGTIAVGNLVCSEVSRTDSARENGREADILFAIGSEAMFTNPAPNEFNLMNAQLRATETGRAVIRANKFGPSAYIDARGNVIGKLPYGESGVLFASVPAHTDHATTLYSTLTEYPFIGLLSGYVLFLWFLGFLWTRKVKKPWFYWFLKIRRSTEPPA